jgi:hypothetical protein
MSGSDFTITARVRCPERVSFRVTARATGRFNTPLGAYPASVVPNTVDSGHGWWTCPGQTLTI